MYLNKTQIIGNLTRDPELKALPSGMKVCSFSVATNRRWKDKETNQEKEEVEFHNIIAFGRTAEVIAQWVKRGHQIYVEGRLQTRSWDKDGVKMYRTEIVVNEFQFGNKPKDAVNENTTSQETIHDRVQNSTPARSKDIEDAGDGFQKIDYPEDMADDNNLEKIPF